MILGTVIFNLLALGLAQKDEKRWVWNKNERNKEERSYSPDRFDTRYEVDENIPEGTGYYPNQGPIYENHKPVYVPNQQGPNGLYSSPNRPDYYAEQSSPGILTGPVPSWVAEGPIKNYDRCKCTEKFNCNSPGIFYGHCDVGKQYCCHATKKQGIIGGPIPANPIHSPDNGILVGPGGPIDHVPLSYPRPPLHQNGPNGFIRPGNGYGLRGGQGNGYGLNRRPVQNVYSAENGILVGPGGPYDRPHYGRQG